MAVIIRWLGTLLTVVGVGMLLGTAGLYAYGLVEEQRVMQELASAEHSVETQPTIVSAVELAAPTEAPATPAPEPATPTSVAVESVPSGVAFESGSDAVDVQRAHQLAERRVGPPTPTPTPPPPTPTPVPLTPPVRIVAPSIGLNAPVVVAPFKNGEWEVPKYVAGYLEGTALPGEGGNVALSGHVSSIAAGNVFANLERLKVGDRVRLQTKVLQIEYEVREIKVVENDDVTVVAPTRGERLTLITCTGTWSPLTRDYSHRFVAVALPVSGGEARPAAPG